MSASRSAIWWGGAAVACAAVALAAGAAQEPDRSTAGVYETGRLGLITQPDQVAPPVGPSYGVGPYPLYPPELAAGGGREVVERDCGLCHSTVYITMQPPLPRAAWQATVQKMIRTFGAPIPEDAAGAITEYLAAHYTPETRVR
jgi:cytochrome c5